MRYEPDENEQLSIITRALRFANDHPEGKDDRSWATRQYRNLKVLPPRAPYFVDNHGNVFGRKGRAAITILEVSAKASPLVLKRRWCRLREALEEICDYLAGVPDSVRGRTKRIKKGSKKIRDENFPHEFWNRRMFQGQRVEPTTQNTITPTIDAFVELAVILMADLPWSGRISKCDQCGIFFITPRRRGGRRPRVCGDSCAAKRGDPNRITRQREFRERRAKQKPK